MAILKHNFTALFGGNVSVWDLTSGVNQASGAEFVLSYAILSVIFIVSSWYFIRKTSDIGKSMTTATYLTFVVSLVLFYAGKVNGVDFIPNTVMFGLAVLLAILIAAIKFLRYNKNESR